MTAITFYSEDKTIIQKFLDLALQFNVKTQMQPVEVDPLWDSEEDDVDAELLYALERLETLPNNQPYSLAQSKMILAELKEMA
jgi:hypothetical protein